MLEEWGFYNVNVILELLHVNHKANDMTLFSKEEIDFVIEYCCTR